jgi:hypothetical protein
MATLSLPVSIKRYSPNRERIFTEFSHSPEEIRAEEIVSACGALPLGTQRGLGITPDLFLFVDGHRGTVGVPLVRVSVATVKRKLLESERRWNRPEA